MVVKFNDLSGSTQEIKKEFLERAATLLDKANFVLTDEVKDFERAWASYIGTEHAVGVSNGSDALWLALKAFNIGPGDEVITQGNAYNASVTAILRAGAIPRYVDIDAKTLLMDAAKIEERITPTTRAIMPVHLYGQASDMSAIMAVAKKRKLTVIEDCAQAHGAEWKGKKVGAWGDAAGWSFYPTKNLGAFGDAGAVTTPNAKIAEEVRMLRNLGQAAKNEHVRLGYNMRLDALQAIVLSLKLPHLAEAMRKRQLAAVRYDKLFDEAQLPVKYVSRHTDATHVYHLYTIQLLKGDRENVRKQMAEKGVETGVYYPVLVMNQPFYPKELPRDACPVAAETTRSALSLPLHADITSEEQEYVVGSLVAILQ